MVRAAIQSRTRFLKTSAHYYASIEPTTSAHLMSQCDFEASGSEPSAKENKAHAICKGCGTILIPGWTLRETILKRPGEIQRPRLKKQPRHTMVQHEKHMRIDCLKCYRFEEKPLDVVRSGRGESSRIIKPQIATSTAESNPPSMRNSQSSPSLTTNNASSRQRAKARKRGGLQAMLEKSKVSTRTSSSFGLDLLDLMKQG